MRCDQALAARDIGKLYIEHQNAIEEQCMRALVVPENTAGIVLSMDRVSLPVRSVAPAREGGPSDGGPVEVLTAAAMSLHHMANALA
ncbi:MAG: hypothetical protein Q8Q09_21425 [Deltaproteobacteria bacterium]|nr:hypothetical protein [Deltaproteobacteria bacterium]